MWYPNPDEPEPKIYFTAEHAEDTEKTTYQKLSADSAISAVNLYSFAILRKTSDFRP